MIASWALAIALTAPDGALELAAQAEAKLLAGQFEAARELWERAYAIDPSPPYLWGAGQASRLAGDCAAAIDYYDRFLAALDDVPEKTAHAVELNSSFCRDQLAEAPPKQPEPSPPKPVVDRPPPPKPAPLQPPPTTDDRPWFRSPAGGTLLGVGLATGAAAGILGAVALSRRARAIDAPTEDAYGDAFDSADNLRLGGQITAAIAGAITASAIVVYAVVAARRR